MSKKVFELLNDIRNLGDDTHHATLFKGRGVQQLHGFTSAKEIEAPDSIFFQANFTTITETDFLFCNVTWPIISQKMLETLLSVSDFSHQVIPVVMLDDTILDEKYFDENSKIIVKKANFDFLALQLTTHFDGFDWEKSVYRKHWRNPQRVLSIKKLVFKESIDNFPPIFRLSVKPTQLFVSEEGKKALENADVKGVKFREIVN